MATSSPSGNCWRTVIRRRSLVITCVVVLWGLTIEGRLIHLQVLRHDALVAFAEAQRSRSIETKPKRGEILDREGRVLAYSVDADTVMATPREVVDPAVTARQLCDVLKCEDAQQERIETRLGEDRGFAYVQRHVSVAAARRIKELDLEGIGIIKESRRFYPHKELGAHLLGYVGIDNGGLAGLESSFDEEIRGRSGRSLVQFDARRRPFSRVERPPTAGSSLELSIDMYLQYIAERELRATVLEHGASGGSVVVMEPATGEILALANEPSFNPNRFANFTAESRRNRATQDVYEPGSTFKIVTASAALEEQVFHPDHVFDVSPGFIRFGARRVEDIGNYGSLSFTDVLVKSSNVGAIKIGLELGRERLSRYVRRFGFGQSASRDFAGQSHGIVHEPSRLNDSGLASLSMGYNISVTPLQMAAAASAVANGGELIEPRLVRAIVSADQRRERPRRVVRRAVSEETASTLTRIMEDVVTRGTARNAQLDGYTAAGKTGTTEKIVNGRYSETGHNVASFVGFVPSTRPALTILVVIDDVARFGGGVAAPAFQRIAEASLRYRGVPPNVDAPSPVVVSVDTRPVPQERSTKSLRSEIDRFQPGQMPDLRGLGVRAALKVATEMGLAMEPHGRGFVVDQSILPGSAVAGGQTVAVWFERVGAADGGTKP